MTTTGTTVHFATAALCRTMWPSSGDVNAETICTKAEAGRSAQPPAHHTFRLWRTRHPSAYEERMQFIGAQSGVDHL